MFGPQPASTQLAGFSLYQYRMAKKVHGDRNGRNCGSLKTRSIRSFHLETILAFCLAIQAAGLLTLILIAMKLSDLLRSICRLLGRLLAEADAIEATTGTAVRELRRIGSKMQKMDQQSSSCDQPGSKPWLDLQSIQTALHTNN